MKRRQLQQQARILFFSQQYYNNNIIAFSNKTIPILPSSSQCCYLSSSLPQSQHQHFNNNEEQEQQQQQHQNDKSNRVQFKEIPVNVEILRYIERIGVGRKGKKKKKKRNGNLSESSLLDAISTRGRRARQSKSTSSSTTTSSNILEPPPPFSIGGGDGNKKRVEVIGSIQSVNDAFPPNKNEVAEIAIAGRSNVGKSTLLNALLYGNQSLSSSNHDQLMIRRRGKVPQRAKLPKGHKAKTSSKPGETRSITFYNLMALLQQEKKQQQEKEEVFVTPRLQKNNNNGWGSKKNDKKKTAVAPKNFVPTSKQQLRLVDLPGYGFAFASKPKVESSEPDDGTEVHDTIAYNNQYQNMIQKYVLSRGKVLKRILLLIDARHGMKKADFDFLQALQDEQQQQQDDDGNNESQDYSSSRRLSKKKIQQQKQKHNVVILPPIQIVLTKCDLVNQVDLARRVVLVREQLSDALQRETSSLPVMLVSAKAGVGFNNIRRDYNEKNHRALGGVLELQKELAALAPPKRIIKKAK